eukprot:1148097-Pelagomonas_calceolata.AAC.5
MQASNTHQHVKNPEPCPPSAPFEASLAPTGGTRSPAHHPRPLQYRLLQECSRPSAAAAAVAHEAAAPAAACIWRALFAACRVRSAFTASNAAPAATRILIALFAACRVHSALAGFTRESQAPLSGRMLRRNHTAVCASGRVRPLPPGANVGRATTDPPLCWGTLRTWPPMAGSLVAL